MGIFHLKLFLKQGEKLPNSLSDCKRCSQVFLLRQQKITQFLQIFFSSVTSLICSPFWRTFCHQSVRSHQQTIASRQRHHDSSFRIKKAIPLGESILILYMAVNCIGMCYLSLRKLCPHVKVAIFLEVCDVSCPLCVWSWMLAGDLGAFRRDF